MEQGVIRWWPLLGGPDPLREQCRRSFADKAPSKAATRSLGARVLSVLCELVSPRWRSVFDVIGSGGDLTPVCKRRYAALLECFPVDEVTFQIEMVVDIGVDRGELL